MKVLKIINERVFKAGYVLRRELVETGVSDEPTMEWTMAYTPDGHYIGCSRDAHRLVVKRGIHPQPTKPDHSVCSIGFSNKSGKWYGWSHRAICGFKIGSTCKKGDCHYIPNNKKNAIEDAIRFWTIPSHKNVKAGKEGVVDGMKGIWITWVYTNDIPNEKIRGAEGSVFWQYPEVFGKGEWTAKTVADARQMACDFASSVS